MNKYEHPVNLIIQDGLIFNACGHNESQDIVKFMLAREDCQFFCRVKKILLQECQIDTLSTGDYILFQGRAFTRRDSYINPYFMVYKILKYENRSQI